MHIASYTHNFTVYAPMAYSLELSFTLFWTFKTI